MSAPPPPAPPASPGPWSPPSQMGVPTQLVCPNCSADISPTASFCEACGASLTPAQAAPEASAEDEALESPITLSVQVKPVPDEKPDDVEETVLITRPCANCGGVVGEDGYCQTCGTKAPTERDHYTEHPARWVAACCDKGIRHFRNEDATAVAAEPEPGGRAVLVVCDGVSTSVDSDVASLAGARAAREVLLANRSTGIGVPASRDGALTGALVQAAASANAAVVANTAPDSDNAASCTFAAAVVDGDVVAYGNVGDSRVYWVPDRPPVGAATAEAPRELSVDDSVAQARIAMGVPREEAENGPQAHAITKWLGRDSPDFVPRTGTMRPSSPGWLVVCSDGLWNYVSEATDLQTLIAAQATASPTGPTDPLALAVNLVNWANGQGGKDNISVALARIGG